MTKIPSAVERRIRAYDNGEIQIVSFDWERKSVEIMVPYDQSSIEIDIEGDTEDELVECFVEKVNFWLENMIDSLESCKLTYKE